MGIERGRKNDEIDGDGGGEIEKFLYAFLVGSLVVVERGSEMTLFFNVSR